MYALNRLSDSVRNQTVATKKKGMWRRLTLPSSCPDSTISAERLDFRVRNGNGYFPLAKTTTKLVRMGWAFTC